MKKTIKNYFQLGVLFFGITLFLWNCQNEGIEEIIEPNSEINFTTVSQAKAEELFQKHQKKVLSSISLSARSNDTPSILEVNPDWDSFEQQELDFIEALFSKVSAEINVNVNFDIRVVFLQMNDFYLKLIQSTDAITTFEDGSIKEGKVYYHELDGTFVEGYTIENGFAVKKLVPKQQVNKASFLSFFSFFTSDCSETYNPADEFCSQLLDEVVIPSNKPHEWHVVILYEEPAITETPNDGSDVGRSGGGGGDAANDEAANEVCQRFGKTWNKDEKRCECPSGQNEDDYGTCIVEEKVISELDDNEDCILNKLKELGLYKSTIEKFENSESLDLTFKNGNCSNTNIACTDASDIDNGNITIIIEEGVNGRPLEFAATLLHEGIHAELFKYTHEYFKGLDPNKRANFLFHYFEAKKNVDLNFVDATAQHQHMADKYVRPIAEAIRALDNNKYPLEYYMGFGWDGLRKYGYDGYYDNGIWVTLDKSTSSDYYKKQKVVNDNTNLKSDDCKD